VAPTVLGMLFVVKFSIDVQYMCVPL